jgi:hypothetical protein
LSHITDDGGYTYLRYESYLMLGDAGGVDMRVGDLESDPETLDRLQRIWIEYQKNLGETIFRV